MRCYYQSLPLLSLRYLFGYLFVIIRYNLFGSLFGMDASYVYILGCESRWRDGEHIGKWHYFCTITSGLGFAGAFVTVRGQSYMASFCVPLHKHISRTYHFIHISPQSCITDPFLSQIAVTRIASLETS